MSSGDSPLGRNLATVDDVKKFLPGYEPQGETELTLQGLIESLSIDLYDRSGREFVTLGDDDPRQFEISPYHCRTRVIRIGDLKTLDDVTVEIVEQDGTLVQTVDAAAFVSYPRGPRDAWKPITALLFPPRVAAPAQLAPCRLLQVTGAWGFPSIPRNVREGIAKLAVVRYVSDVAEHGTEFSDALADVDVPAMFRSATESLATYAPKGSAR